MKVSETYVVELIRRESHNNQLIAKLVLELVVQRILNSGLTEGGYIDQQKGLAAKLRKVEKTKTLVEVGNTVLVDAVIVSWSCTRNPWSVCVLLLKS